MYIYINRDRYWVFIYIISLTDFIISEALKIIVSRNTDDMFRPDNLEHRLVWSPYIPQEDDEEQDTCCIVVTHGNDVSQWFKR